MKLPVFFKPMQPMKNTHNAISFHHKPQQNYISIIIPAHKRTHLLQNTLNSIITQTLTQDQYEVIIGNDGGDPAVKQTCDQYNVTSITINPHQGSYVARNTALAYARGEIIALIDSDILVPPNWLEMGRQHMQKRDYIGGPVIIQDDVVAETQGHASQNNTKHTNPYATRDNNNSTKKRNLFHTYELHTAYQAHAYLAQFHFLLTGNLFVKRSVIEAIGGFDRRLKSSGDFEFGDRVWRAGYTQQYMPKLEVIHPPTTYITMLRKQQRLAKGSVTLQRIYPQRFPNQKVQVFKTFVKMWIPRFDMATFPSLPFHQYICMYLIRYSFHIALHFWKIWYTVISYKKDSRS
jgi:glycosyltransferase involved in cell wall biosynthesis